jgi:hypothetical protein
MRVEQSERYDFFLSRRGSVAAIAREVEDALAGKGYKVLVQDYDSPFGGSFVDVMHDGVKNSRDLVVLFTRDYEQSPYTRKEFTSFEKNARRALKNGTSNAQCRSNKGAPGVDGQEFADIEAYGVAPRLKR